MTHAISESTINSEYIPSLEKHIARAEKLRNTGVSAHTSFLPDGIISDLVWSKRSRQEAMFSSCPIQKLLFAKGPYGGCTQYCGGNSDPESLVIFVQCNLYASESICVNLYV